MSKLCRFNDSSVGIVRGGQLLDIIRALEDLPQVKWPLPVGDQVVARLGEILARADTLAKQAPQIPLSALRLHAPVANPA